MARHSNKHRVTSQDETGPTVLKQHVRRRQGAWVVAPNCHQSSRKRGKAQLSFTKRVNADDDSLDYIPRSFPNLILVQPFNLTSHHRGVSKGCMVRNHWAYLHG
jgi:hypothetical protein